MRDEKGQTSVEWLALCAFVVTVIVALSQLAPDIAHEIGKVVTDAIDRVTHL